MATLDQEVVNAIVDKTGLTTSDALDAAHVLTDAAQALVEHYSSSEM